MPYKPEILIELAQTYLYADNDFWLFVHRHSRGDVLQLDTPEEERAYLLKEKEAALTLDALRYACRLVGADRGAVLATAKAMIRRGRRTHLPNNAHRFFSRPSAIRAA